MKTFKIENELAKKYHGCGVAVATVKLRFDGSRRFLDTLVDFEYINPDSTDMSPDAGMVHSYHDKNGQVLATDPENFMDSFETIEGGVFAKVTVNLSCYEACLG